MGLTTSRTKGDRAMRSIVRIEYYINQPIIFKAELQSNVLYN